MNKVRPIYQTDEDVSKEVIAARLIAKKLTCNVKRNKDLFMADYSLIKNGRVTGLGEIKVRTTQKETYDTYYISAEKIQKCSCFAREFGIPFNLFVWWSDGLYCLNIVGKGGVGGSSCDFLEINGRTDRGDKKDIEIVAHYHHSKFVFVGNP